MLLGAVYQTSREGRSAPVRCAPPPSNSCVSRPEEGRKHRIVGRWLLHVMGCDFPASCDCLNEVDMKPIPQSRVSPASLALRPRSTTCARPMTVCGSLRLTVAEFGTADWLIHAQPGTPLAVGLKALDYDNPELIESSMRTRTKNTSPVLLMFCKDENVSEVSWVQTGCRARCRCCTQSRHGWECKAGLFWGTDTLGGVECAGEVRCLYG
jgi:hypothetical protein